MTATLVAHCGSRYVDRDELSQIEAPSPTATWFPIKHTNVLATVGEALHNAGFAINREQIAVSANNARMFATLDLAQPVANGVNLSVGIRNSCDKSFPLGFVAGSRVFVCDNLSFRSDLLVKRKHTRFGSDRFREAITHAVQSLQQFEDVERHRITRFQGTEVNHDAANSFILEAFEQGIVSWPKLPDLLAAWKAPQHESFLARTWWSLFNAFTGVLAPVAVSNPQRFADGTMKLQRLIDQRLEVPQAV